MGVLLDRFGERIVLGAGMFLWSLTQTATGFVKGFASFVAARIGLEENNEVCNRIRIALHLSLALAALSKRH
jgi:MFS family permease